MVARSHQTQNRDNQKRFGGVNALDQEIAMTWKWQKHSSTAVLDNSPGLDKRVVEGRETKLKMKGEWEGNKT